MKPLAKIPVPWGWYLGIVGLIVVSVAVSASMLSLVPQQMPARVSSGLVALGGSYSPPMSTGTLIARVTAGPLLVLIISVGISVLISSQSARLWQNHPDASAVAVGRRWAFLNNVQSCLGWFSFFTAAILAVSSIRFNSPGFVTAIEMSAYVVCIAVLSWALLVSLRRGQLLIDRALPMGEDDTSLKWGLVYHNPADPRVFVELDGGQTTVVNMARPASWGLVVAMVIPAIFIVGLVIYVS
ncbi:hypothetical protein [Corynebacterium gallinarum]|uniref:DUF5808 domain-containing protein n=1 Tax=Corynebacterium gallinarum TaxID=2762214 RepID=A0A8I0LG39_9CORY|nr:hypothetical protein [Corynebacterium gallinarum]MBD8030709.1 hypothetical protein [Corynebacterium gallinarum]NMB22437.1 hypothetical protein [Corynebacterium sp.]